MARRAHLFPRPSHPRRVKYADLAAFFERLEATPGRLEMTRILVELLEQVPKSEMAAVVRLLQGAVAPDWEGLEVGLAEKQILKSLAMAQGGSTKSESELERLETLYHEKGDLGLAAQYVVAAQGRRKQASLFGSSPLTVPEVFQTVLEIANTTGAGSQEGKQRLLSKLLLSSTPLEARYITRMVAGRLRLGVADMIFLDALAAWHVGKGVRSVTEMEDAEREAQTSVRAALERAYDFRSDLAVVATTLAAAGMKGIAKLDVELGTPVRPMAAERLKSLPEILQKMEGRVSMEYKYDGLRIQAHVPADAKSPVRLFSRRLENLTDQFPDVAENLRRHLAGRDCIVEGEAVALDDAGRLRPFQDVSRRRGRKTDIGKMSEEIPVTMFLFDCLADGGASVMEEDLDHRRLRLTNMLRDGKGSIRVSEQKQATSADDMERFFDQAIEDGAEGIMCKDPRAAYKAGARGFAWIKFKADYTQALVDTLDLVPIGAFYGRGRRAGWYGALLLAAYDEDEGRWASVCKLGTGFDDSTLMGLKDRFAKQVSKERPRLVDSEMEPDVWFEPSIVMEVQAAELTVSPIHRAGASFVAKELGKAGGLAARFPRFTGRWREDKGPKDATTVAELVKMLELQRRTG
jgi:DNA ligase-1